MQVNTSHNISLMSTTTLSSFSGTSFSKTQDNSRRSALHKGAPSFGWRMATLMVFGLATLTDADPGLADDYFVENGETVSGQTVSAGDTQQIKQGGRTIDVTVAGQAKQVVLFGGDALRTVVLDGGQQDVAGTVTDTILRSGGIQQIRLSGVATGTQIDAGARMIVEGNSIGAFVRGTQDVSGEGLARGTIIENGGVQILAGPDAAASDTIIQAGGRQEIRDGFDIDTQINGGEQFVSGGAVAGTILNAGRQHVAGGTVTGTTINGGVQLVVGGAVSETTINRGTLQIGDGGTSGSIIGDVMNNGLVAFNRADVYTFAGVIGGSGAVGQIGDGTTILAADNVYTGGTMIAGGALQLGDGGASGGIVGDVANSGLLAFNRSDVYTFVGMISGNGAVGQVGDGTTVLTADNVYTGGTTITGGTLQFGDGGSTGSVVGPIFNESALVFNRSGELTYDGVISGSGTLTKAGDGLIILTADHMYTGSTTVQQGMLSVNGSIANSIVSVNGGTLGGVGTVGATNVGSGGTIAPGDSIGTLTVAGDLTFQPGSAYAVEIAPGGRSDLLRATGGADILGGTVLVTGSHAVGTRYTILTAAGGVTGKFNGMSEEAPFIDLSLFYDANNVYLDVVRNQVGIHEVAHTPNHSTTGIVIHSQGPGDPIHDALVVAPNEKTARQALDLLSGEIHASIKGALLQDSRFVREAALDRMRAAFEGVTASSSTVMSYTSEEALARQGKSAGTFTPAAADTSGFAVWARGFGSWGKWDSDGNAADFERSIGGFVIGADGPIGDWRVGALTGYSRSSFHGDDRISSGESDNYHLGLYGGRQWSNLGLRLGVAHTWHNIDTVRGIAFPGFADSTLASYDIRTAQAFGELSYQIDHGGFAFEPFANLAYVNVHTDGFAEDGGAAMLTGASSNTDATFTTLGLRAAADFSLGATKATARGMIGWRHAIGDTTPAASFAFTGSDFFTIAGTPIAEDALALEAGFDIGVSERASLGVSYSGQIASQARDHGFRADFTLRF